MFITGSPIVSPTPNFGLSTGSEAGIGIGALVAFAAILTSLWVAIRA